MRVLTIFLFLISVSANSAQNVATLKLGAGDVIDVFVAGSPDLSSKLKIALDGSINMPLIGKVQLGGKTSSESEVYIEHSLKERGFLRKPNVEVSIINSVKNEVTILGAVPQPGKYPIGPSNETLIDLLALAGGVGTMNKVVLLRTDKNTVLRYEYDIEDLILNGDAEAFTSGELELIQGDVVYIKKAPVFYTYGEIGAVSVYELKKKLTLMQAISMAGGLTKIADENDINVKRKFGSEYKSIKVDFDEFILEDDIIVVDESLF